MDKKSKQNRTQYISEENVKNFLEKNNISIEKVGGEKEQKEYIARLSKDLLTCKKNITAPEKHKNIGNVLINIGETFKEAGISEADSKKIIKNFIPEKILSQDDAKSIKQIRDEVKEFDEKIKKLIEYEKRLIEEKEELEKRLEELEKGETVSNEKEPFVIKTEGEEIENSDLKFAEMYVDMFKTISEYYKNNKALENQKEKNYKTITEGVKDICKWADNVLVKNILINDKFFMRSCILGGAFVATTGVVLIPGYVAARVAGKTIKGFAKLGAKAVGGVGKVVYTGVKGAARGLKGLMDKRRNDRTEKIKKSLDKLDIAEEIVTMILNDSLNKGKKVTEENNIIFDDLPEEKQLDLEAIMNDDTRPATKEKLEQENEKLLVVTNRRLRKLRLEGIIKKFDDKLGLDAISVAELMRDFKIDENGELVEIDESFISLDEIRDAGLYDELKEAIEIPKVNKFSGDDLKDIINLLKSDDNMMQNLDELVEKEEISPEVAEYVAEIRDSLKDGFISYSDIDSVYEEFKTIELNNNILREAYLRDLFDVANELYSQITIMKNELESMKDISTKDVKRAKILRKIAEAKVNSLIKHGIVEIVRDENGREQIVINEGKDVLGLTEDLENINDLKRDRIERQSQESKQDTEHSDSAEQGDEK